MTTSPIHEIYKHLLGRMVDTIGEELDIPMFGQGSTTFNREDVDRGLEPDECYYIANAGRVADRSQLNLETDPPPDLAIEIEITRNVLDRLGIYAALGVPEVWRFDGEIARRFAARGRRDLLSLRIQRGVPLLADEGDDPVPARVRQEQRYTLGPGVPHVGPQRIGASVSSVAYQVGDAHSKQLGATRLAATLNVIVTPWHARRNSIVRPERSGLGVCAEGSLLRIVGLDLRLRGLILIADNVSLSGTMRSPSP